MRTPRSSSTPPTDAHADAGRDRSDRADPRDVRPTAPMMRPRGRPADEARVLPGNCLTVEAVTVSGRAAAIDFRVRQDGVEVWHHLRLAAVFDRAVLRDWLARPDRPLAVDEVILSLDRMIDVDGRVAVSLPDIQVWPLSPRELELLRRRV